MHTSPNTLSRYSSLREITATSSGRRGSLSLSTDLKIDSLEDRLLYVRTQTIIDEFSLIRAFFKKLKKFGFRNTQPLKQIDNILVTLNYSEKNHEYRELVDILMKYLFGIRKFLLTVNERGIVFYKNLFESTLIAIERDLNSSR